MSKHTKENTFHINIGSSSVLLIFVILCLVAFAALSIVSANADAKLSNKVAQRTKIYYEAHNQAVADIAALDEQLAELYASCASEDAYYTQAGTTKTYEYPISELQSLSVKVGILYPKQDKDTFYEITAWQVVTDGEVEYENNMIVIP
ncbi:MAG: hypothetical protein IJ379_09050 [Lachnospiraceae bacterium]|nr:hypothetical protein [Lachnospiraceae bacterium]